jgi:hypothetical protein
LATGVDHRFDYLTGIYRLNDFTLVRRGVSPLRKAEPRAVMASYRNLPHFDRPHAAATRGYRAAKTAPASGIAGKIKAAARGRQSPIVARASSICLTTISMNAVVGLVAADITELRRRRIKAGSGDRRSCSTPTGHNGNMGIDSDRRHRPCLRLIGLCV